MKHILRKYPGASAFCAAAGSLAFTLALSACGDGNTALADPTPASPPVQAAANTVTVAAAPEAELIAHVGVPRIVSLVFRADTGNASGLALSLPQAPGWRAADDAPACATVDTAGTCRLQLVYLPAAPAASSSLRLSYAYTDSAGAARQGATTLAYRALPANTVVTSQQPAGMVAGVVGRGTTVTLDFATSDGEAATSLDLAGSLAGLPAGWTSGTPEFACAGIGAGQPCRLTLAYSPAAPQAAAGFDLAYRYVDSSGASRSGTAWIAYSAVAPGSVAASVEPGGLVLAKPGQRKEVTLRFTAGDGGASALRLLDGPDDGTGWRIEPGWQGCASVQGSDSCSLTMVFAPDRIVGRRTLSLPFTYLDNTGGRRSGSVDLDYASRIYEAYIADYREDEAGGVRLCTVAADGRFANCTTAAIDLPGQGRQISHVLASGRLAYVASLASGAGSSVHLCSIAADGALQDCRASGGVRTGVRRVLLHGASAYLLTGEGSVLRQDLDVASGAIRDCPASRGSCETAVTGMPAAALGFAGSKAYISRPGGPRSYLEAIQCGIAQGGDLDCSAPPFYVSPQYYTTGGLAIAQSGSLARMYIVGEPYYPLLDGKHSVIACDLPADGAVAGCRNSPVATLLPSGPGPESVFLQDIGFSATHAYIVKQEAIYVCDIDAASGALPNCRSFAGTGAGRPLSVSVNQLH